MRLPLTTTEKFWSPAVSIGENMKETNLPHEYTCPSVDDSTREHAGERTHIPSPIKCYDRNIRLSSMAADSSVWQALTDVSVPPFLKHCERMFRAERHMPWSRKRFLTQVESNRPSRSANRRRNLASVERFAAPKKFRSRPMPEFCGQSELTCALYRRVNPGCSLLLAIAGASLAFTCPANSCVFSISYRGEPGAGDSFSSSKGRTPAPSLGNVKLPTRFECEGLAHRSNFVLNAHFDTDSFTPSPGMTPPFTVYRLLLVQDNALLLCEFRLFCINEKSRARSLISVRV